MVPGDKVYDARLKLAGQGLPKAGNVGFEVLENQKLGTSQFVEQVNYQRALESELSSSIKTLAQVREARVHLAIPKTSAFLRDQPKPTASVVLSLHPGRVVDDQQVTAITHLVSSSVPQLLPAMVTVVDSDGGLLAPNPSRSGASGMDAAQIKYVAEVENQVARRIVTILEPVTGRDNVRAQVAVDVDFTQSERAEEIFKPNSGQNPASIRSQQNLEATGPVTSAGGIPGALTNQPPQGGQAPIEGQPGQGQAQPPGTQSPVSTNAARKEQTVNYEVDRAIQTVRGPRASVKRVSTAVIVNFKKTVDAEGNTKETAYTQQEIQQMTSLVRDAMGFSQQRGDSVSVVSIPFSPPVSDEPPFWKQATFASVMKEFFKFLIIATVLGLVTVFLVRPILFPPPPKVVEEEQRIEEEFDERVKAELQAMSPAAREKRRLELELERERRRIQEEEERQRLEEERRILEEKRKREEEDKAAEYEELLAYAKEFVQKDPRVVAAIFKQWLQDDVEKGLA
jgi:flagellar M-ring protein FliF